MPNNSPYCCAKGELRMMTRTICQELSPYNITVNNIAPGAIQTPIDADVEADPEKMKALLAEIPLHRMGQPEEIGKLVVFLASDAQDEQAGWMKEEPPVLEPGECQRLNANRFPLVESQ